MPKIQSWDEFAKASEKLYTVDPLKTRVVTKYRHNDGLVRVKVTNDRDVLIFETDQAQDIKRIDKFEAQLMRLMASKDK